MLTFGSRAPSRVLMSLRPKLHISEQTESIRTMMATSLEQHACSPHGDILRIPGNLV